MLDGKKFDFEIKYGDAACECLLSGNMLYIANYHHSRNWQTHSCFWRFLGGWRVAQTDYSTSSRKQNIPPSDRREDIIKYFIYQ